MINWDKIEEDYSPKFKAYFADGDYTAKCNGIEFKEVGTNGSIIAKFSFEEEEKGQYPTADHWCTFKEGKDGWRQHHMKCLMVVLGASEENARKAVEMCESKTGKENIVKAYESAFKKLLAKSPSVDIEVYTEGKYARAEFKDPTVHMPRSEEKKESSTQESIIEQGEEIDLSDDALPF